MTLDCLILFKRRQLLLKLATEEAIAAEREKRKVNYECIS